MRRFFYLQGSDRRILLALLIIVCVGTTIIWLTSGETGASTTDADSMSQSCSLRSQQGYN